MVLNGYKRPLVQEDMWDMRETDTTSHIHRCFQAHMQVELDAARVRLHRKKEKMAQVVHRGLQNGVTPDALLMVGILEPEARHAEAHTNMRMYTWKGAN